MEKSSVKKASRWVPFAPWELSNANLNHMSNDARIDNITHSIAIDDWNGSPVIEKSSIEKTAQYIGSYAMFALLASLPLYGIYLNLFG